MKKQNAYKKDFLPYAFAAFLIGTVGGFSTILGPNFVQELKLDYNQTTWTALAQAMATAAWAPLLGKMGDLIGQKRTLILGIGIFTLGNAMSALAHSLTVMLAARFAVGLGTAAMAPVILAFILTRFPKNQVTRGFSLYMLISSGSVIAGPTLGSLLAQALSWRAVMWLCTGLSFLIFAICLFFRSEDPSATGQIPARFDTTGGILTVLFFSFLLCIPSFGQNFGWHSKPFLGVLLAGFLSLSGLLLAENRAQHPLLPGMFIRQKTFFLSVMALFLTQGLMQANMTNMMIFVNYTHPSNTVISGYAISVMYLGMALGAVFLGPLADRIQPKHVLTGSLLLTGLGCGILLFLTETVSVWILMASLGILGFGLGGNGTVFMKVVLSGIPPEMAGSGTGIYGLFRDLSAPFGVAVLVPLFTNGITRLMETGFRGPEAAVQSMHMLSAVELACIAGGIGAVRCLPKNRLTGEEL